MRLLRGDMIATGQGYDAAPPFATAQNPIITANNPMVPSNGLPQPPGCPMVAGSIVIDDLTALVGVGDFDVGAEFGAVGQFCPRQMNITASVDLSDVWVTSIQQGRRDQVLQGRINAQLFSLSNPCCYVGCLPCVCAPGVGYTVGIANTDAMAQDITGLFYGSLVDWCPPAGMSMSEYVAQMMPPPPGCSYDDALIGIDIVIPASGVFSADIETPGIFCPRKILATGANIATMFLSEWKTGRLSDIIGAGVPLSSLAPTVECCPPLCFRCSCAPGVPIHVEVTGVAGNTAHIDIVGGYRDVCP